MRLSTALLPASLSACTVAIYNHQSVMMGVRMSGMTHLVHVDSELCPPLGHTQSEHCVGCHCGQGHSGIGGAAAVSLNLKGIIFSLSEDVIIKRGICYQNTADK